MSASDDRPPASGSRQQRIAALNALDLALGSQEAEAERHAILLEFLPLLDAVRSVCPGFEDLDAAEMRSRAARVAMLADLVERALTGLDLEPTAGEGLPFDKRLHETVDTCEGPPEEHGRIVDVIEQGWRHRGTVVRRACVVVQVRGPSMEGEI